MVQSTEKNLIQLTFTKWSYLKRTELQWSNWNVHHLSQWQKKLLVISLLLEKKRRKEKKEWTLWHKSIQFCLFALTDWLYIWTHVFMCTPIHWRSYLHNKDTSVTIIPLWIIFTFLFHSHTHTHTTYQTIVWDHSDYSNVTI